MCVTVYQTVGYAVPSKKIRLKQQNSSNYSEVLKGYRTYELNDDQTLYVVVQNDSSCECGDENGDGREFERDTFSPLVYDEDDMELCGKKKKDLFSKLQLLGLDKHATFGIYTTTCIDNH